MLIVQEHPSGIPSAEMRLSTWEVRLTQIGLDVWEGGVCEAQNRLVPKVYSTWRFTYSIGVYLRNNTRFAGRDGVTVDPPSYMGCRHRVWCEGSSLVYRMVSDGAGAGLARGRGTRVEACAFHHDGCPYCITKKLTSCRQELAINQSLILSLAVLLSILPHLTG